MALAETIMSLAKTLCRPLPETPSRFPLRLICVVLLASTMFWPRTLAAQTNRGSIVGRVADSGGAVLWGAEITLEPSGSTTVSDEVGQFSFLNFPQGDYTVNISYVGFSPYRGSVKVASGQTVRIDAVMKVESHAEEVLVTAERAYGEAEAINRTRASDNILQV